MASIEKGHIDWTSFHICGLEVGLASIELGTAKKTTKHKPGF